MNNANNVHMLDCRIVVLSMNNLLGTNMTLSKPLLYDYPQQHLFLHSYTTIIHGEVSTKFDILILL